MTKGLSAAAVVLWVGLQGAAGSASFRGLGTDFDFATAVSPDGQVVVGQDHDGRQAIRWSQEEGAVPLGLISSGTDGDYTRALAATPGGTVVVGQSGLFKGPAFRWTAATGMQPLPLILWMDNGSAMDVSADGSIIVGSCGMSSGGSRAVVWRNGVAEEIVVPGENQLSRWVAGCSADGRTLAVGWSGRVYVGSPSTGYQQLPRLGTDGYYQTPDGISADGTTVVGVLRHGGASLYEAFRWNAAEGIMGLGQLGTVVNSEAMAVSGNGSIIVGRARTSANELRAFLWDAAHGIRNLQEVLQTDCQLDLTGWTLSEAKGISDDGRTIVGYGYNPAGLMESYVAVLPEPCTLALLAAGGWAVLRRRRRGE